MSEHNDVPMWHVEITRTQSAEVFIEGGIEAEARDAAWELIDPDDWDVTDRGTSSAVSARIYRLHEGDRYWTGGPDGHWETVS